VAACSSLSARRGSGGPILTRTLLGWGQRGIVVVVRGCVGVVGRG
jgi:hypothetical protein